MRTIITMITICCCCFTFPADGQTGKYAIKGSVTDTASKTKVDGATVIILNAKDSTLQKFTYTVNGDFYVSNLPAGKFLLIVSHPKFGDHSAEFTLSVANPQKNFGNIAMIFKAKFLQEVIIKGNVIAVKIKGDTTEFNSAAYATQKNGKVDDLLKQLPGMRINQSGKILFQGEQVQKILVDGEEFFGDDPTLVTKNVRADMVSKIQVYNEIHVPAGPESFNGLPGMILQVVLPHEHVNWQATKVTPDSVDRKELIPPKEGTVVNYKQFYRVLLENQGKYGELGKYFIKGFYL